jgi:outer membrane protein assembly factor BamB
MTTTSNKVLTSALVAIAAIALRPTPTDASCVDPSIDEHTGETTGLGSFSAVSSHPIMERTVVASGNEVISMASSDLASCPGCSFPATNLIQNSPNIIEDNEGKYAVFVGTLDGTVTRINIDETTGELSAGWSLNIDRGGGLCGDLISATPNVHLLRFASEAFKATYPFDLVYVPTRYSTGCAGSTTDNRVYALRADTGAIVWIFNETGAVDMDFISGSAFLDPEEDRLYVGSERSDPTQPSLWAIDVLTGTAAWSTSVGGLQTTPVMRGEKLYIGTTTGDVRAINKEDGTIMWNVSTGIPIFTTLFVEFRPPYADLIGVVDAVGQVRLIRDDTTAGTELWQTSVTAPSLDARSRVALDPTNGKAYVGGDDGRIYQLNIVTGAVETHRTVAKSGIVRDSIYAFNDSTFSQLHMLAGTGGTLRKFCTPWSDAVVTSFAPPDGEAGDDTMYAVGKVCVDPLLDCPEPPKECSKYVCKSQVCVLSPIDEGVTCKDGNPDTFGDSCKSGTCVGLSDCDSRFDACECRDAEGKPQKRHLLTKEFAMKIDPDPEIPYNVEVVSVAPTNTCLPITANRSHTIVKTQAFDQFGNPITKAYVEMLMGDSGGAAPEWYDPFKDSVLPKGEPASTENGYVLESGRPGHYWAVLRGPDKGTSSGDPFRITMNVKSGGAGSEDCSGIDTFAGETLVTEVRVGNVEAPPAGCDLFGDTDETGTVVIQVVRPGTTDGLSEAPVQVGFVEIERAYYSAIAYRDFVDPADPPADQPNAALTDENGFVVFEDTGNAINGSNKGEGFEGGGTFPVFVACPGDSIDPKGGGSTDVFYIRSATPRMIEKSCP